ncbi:hypothetical protein FKM82_023113 [Ascaphus truei]
MPAAAVSRSRGPAPPGLMLPCVSRARCSGSSSSGWCWISESAPSWCRRSHCRSDAGTPLPGKGPRTERGLPHPPPYAGTPAGSCASRARLGRRRRSVSWSCTSRQPLT